MNKIRKLGLPLSIFTLAFTLLCAVNAQASTENMELFFDFEFPGLRVQVNATAATEPTENVTLVLDMKGLTEVHVNHFNLSIFGSVHGKDKILMENITDDNLSLNNASAEYNRTFAVPENVWGLTYAEIFLNYSAKYGPATFGYELGHGFTMTYVENVYLKAIEDLLQSINSTFVTNFQMNLTQENLALLNQTYWELKQNITALQQSLRELDNTRMTVAILAVTTVFFVATTVYMVMRKPKEYW